MTLARTWTIHTVNMGLLQFELNVSESFYCSLTSSLHTHRVFLWFDTFYIWKNSLSCWTVTSLLIHLSIIWLVAAMSSHISLWCSRGRPTCGGLACALMETTMVGWNTSGTTACPSPSPTGTETSQVSAKLKASRGCLVLPWGSPSVSVHRQWRRLLCGHDFRSGRRLLGRQAVCRQIQVHVWKVPAGHQPSHRGPDSSSVPGLCRGMDSETSLPELLQGKKSAAPRDVMMWQDDASLTPPPFSIYCGVQW